MADGSGNVVVVQVQMVQNVLWSVFSTKMQPWFLNPGVDTSFPHTKSNPWYSGHQENFSADFLSTF